MFSLYSDIRSLFHIGGKDNMAANNLLLLLHGSLRTNCVSVNSATYCAGG